MSSLEKRHTSRRGSMHGHHKYSDGFSDTSSVGSFMDETDREVSNLTDRAFRSLCIGEEAIYNDSEISSPTERHKAFAEEVQQKEVKTTCQETFSYGIQYREAERKSEVTSTFQHSYVNVAQEQVLRDERMSYMSNGSMEATWQQRRSTSRVSSLIKAFSSREGHCDSGISDAVLLRDKYRDFNNGSWDKSALLSFQRELSEISSAYHQNFKSGPFQSYRNHFHTSAAAGSRMDTTASLVKSSKTKFHALNSTNFFFHSEFSPFQLWKDYNRFPFEREEPSGFVSASEFPRWYDSPLYKELTTTQTFSSEGRRFNRRKIEDVVPTQRSRSTVIQKASAIEKRCESEMASNCPPWKRNNNFVRSKLPSNRPSTVSPTNEKAHRPDSNLLSYNRHTYDIQHKVENVGGNELSGSSTPFSITQLLTPVIHGRQETETSEILQFAHTSSVPDYSVQGDVDLKPLPEVKQLRDNYKSRASSLLFNLKDNRKRVKSTYSPSKFKGLEITDRNKQPSKLEDLESRLSDSSASQVTTQEHSAVSNTWELDVAQQTYDVHLSQTVEHKEYADGLHDMTLAHQNGAANYEISYGGSQGSSLHAYKPPNKENEEYEFSPHMLPAQNKSIENSERHIYGPSGTLNPTRPETENAFSKAHPPVHSLSAQMSEKQTFSRREDMGHHDFKERQNFVTKPNFGYTKNQVTEERLFWENTGHTNITSREMFNSNGIKDSLPFKGEIATLIEMDKQRKSTAKQYLPSANDSYTTGKETYINKVNENIKQGRLAKDEEVRDTKSSSQKYPYTSKPAQYNPTHTPSTSQNVYGFYNNGLHRMTSSPPKDSKLTRNSEFRSTTHDEVRFQRDMNMSMYAASDITTERDYRQKVPCSTSLEEKHQKNEGSVAYQPYKYEPNKQWHIATTENRRTIDEMHLPRQLQTEKISEQPGETYYPHSVLGMPDTHHKNMTYTKTVLEDRLGTGEHQPNDSMVPKQMYQTKHGDMKTDIKKLNIQSTEPYNSSSRGDKFSINDILSIRDNEQAKRIRENKHSLTASVSDPTKLENDASVVASVITEEKAAKMDTFIVKEQQTTEDPTSRYKHESSYGYIRKESHNRNEGLVNIDTAMKDKVGKERTLSYKEKGQTKQEILTSKLKAHAQKEISAIKEKGLAKQGILSRNPIKQSMTVNSDKGQMSQDVMSPKKEITAEKLNHLFQDITYSSVTSYKEHRNQDKDGPKNETLTAEEMKSPTRAVGPRAEVALPEKNNEAVKDDMLTTNEKERTKVQPHTQRIQLQDERITVVDRNTFEFSKSSTDNQKEQSVNKTVNHETVCAKRLLGSPAMNSPNKEASVVKTEEQTSNLPTTCSAGPTEHPTFVEKGMDSPKCIFGKTTTYSLTSYNDSEQAKLCDVSVNKTVQPSKVKVDNLTASRVTTHLECTDLAETTILPVENPHQSRSNPGKETPIKQVYEKKLGPSSRQVNSPSDCTRLKAEALCVESTVESADTKAGPPMKCKAYSTKEGEEGKRGDDIVGDDVTNIKLPKTPEAKEKENPELCAKQNVKGQIESTSTTHETSTVQQLQHVGAPKIKAFESAYRNKGNQTPSNSNKEEKIKPASAEVKEQSLLKEPNQKKEENMHSEKDKALELSQPKQEISSTNFQTNSPEVKTDAVTASSDQQLQQDGDGPPGTENQTQNEKDLHERKEIASEEMKQSKDKSRVNENNSNPTGAENEMSPGKPHTVNVTVNNKDKQSSDIINSVPESHVIHIPSNEDNTSADEPVIYSICVSSKSDAVSEDEPVIYTICVSSISGNSLTDVPVGQEKSGFAQKQLSTEGAEKEEETSGSKNEETKTEETDYHESKSSDDKEAKGLFNTDKAEKETMVRKYDSAATKDKQDYHRSSEVNNISSSYESLLVKYGLAVRENIHLKPEQKEQDKLQGKETEIYTDNLSENVQKNSVDNDCASTETVNTDVSGRLGQESRKPKPLEIVTELLEDDKENDQSISHSVTANGGLKETAAGVMARSDEDTKDKKQFTPENCKLQNEQGITEKQKASEVMPNCVDNQNTRLTVASKQYTKNDNVELKGKKQVGQKVPAVDFVREKGQKEKESDEIHSKNADTVLVESESDNQNINHPAAEISYTNISNNTTVIGSPSQKDSAPPNSKTFETVTEDSRVCDTIDKEVAQTYSCNSVSTKDTEVYLYKLKPDIPPVQNNQKTITERVNADIPEMVSKETALTKDSKASQNRKEFVWKNELLDKKQDKFKTSNETKDRKEITAFSSKQIVKENYSVSEDPLNKASNVVKTDQSLFKTPNTPLEDKKGNKNELKVNKDIVTVQDNLNGQQEQIKTDSVSAKGVVLSRNAISQNTTSQKVTGQKSLSTMGTTEDGSKRLEIQEGKLEPAPSQKESMKDEVTTVNKDSAKKALYLLKVEKDTEGESNKGDMNLKEGTAQDKKDEVTIDRVRKDDGQTKSKVGSVMLKDSSDSIRKDVASSEEVLRIKPDDRTNVYQYHPGKGFLPETKESLYDEQSTVGFSHHDTAFKKKESTSRKPEVTQRDKKTTRPEISALADYARLRVISAEDDSTSEKDLLEKIDTYHKYNLSAFPPQKGLQGNLPVSIGGTDPKRELTVKKNYESQTTESFQVHERDRPVFQRGKITEGILEGHDQYIPRDETVAHQKLSSFTKRSDDRVFAVKELESTKEKRLTNQIQSDTKTSLTEPHHRYQRSHEIHQTPNPVQGKNTQVEGKNLDPAMLRQPVHANRLEKDIYHHVKNQESLPQVSMGSMLNTANKQADNQNTVQPEINEGEKVEELEYYTVTTTKSEPKPKEIHETVPFSDRITSKKEVTEIPTARPRSNSCSPAMGKPTMFRVKDNTIRTSSVSRADKPRFHRSFSEEFRIGSPKEIWRSSEKCELEHGHEHDPKESANPPVFHEPAVASHRLPRAREVQSQNSLSSEFTAAKEPRSYQRRSQVFEDDETRSVVSTMSEDVESFAGSSVVMKENTSHVFERKSNRDTYIRPESACYIRPESACCERPESVCYERPESACSDMRSLGKPPAVPPKSEKALRRAKKLTTRRIQKSEAKLTSESQGQLETKSLRTVSSLPSSPMELLSTHHAVHPSPPISHYHVEPNCAPPAPSLMAHPFPVTQRKLLQDPNSGQYFMVDMPVQVKTKTFFDPETGKYVQLNVRQRTQGTISQPQPVLNHSYVVYPGFLPMSVSSLPSMRSSSQMSAPATVVEEQNKLEASRDPWRSETYQPNNHKNTQEYNKAVHGTHENSGRESLYTDNNVNIASRHTDIITMSELEDFAMEST